MAKKKRNDYTKHEMSFVKNVGYTDKDVAIMLGRTEDAIRMKRYAMANPDKMTIKNREQKRKVRKKEAERLGGRRYDYWTKEEINLILKSKRTDAELSELLGRTINSIQKKRHRVQKEKEDAKRKKDKETT